MVEPGCRGAGYGQSIPYRSDQRCICIETAHPRYHRGKDLQITAKEKRAPQTKNENIFDFFNDENEEVSSEEEEFEEEKEKEKEKIIELDTSLLVTN